MKITGRRAYLIDWRTYGMIFICVARANVVNTHTYVKIFNNVVGILKGLHLQRVDDVQCVTYNVYVTHLSYL
jgi:hypothetical protein